MKNKIIYLNLIFVAIFTLCSFIFDQLVINSEDKIRELNFLEKRSYNNYLKAKNISIYLNEMVNRSIFQMNVLDEKENFLMSANRLILNKDYVNKYYDVELGDQFLKNLKSIFSSRYQQLSYELIFESERVKDIFMGLAIRPLLHSDLDPDKKKAFNSANENILKYSMEIFSTVDIGFEKYRKYVANAFDEKNIDKKDLDNINKEFKKYYNIYNDKIIVHLNALGDIYGIFYNFYYKESEKLLVEKQKFDQKKNIYILLSVLSQILSLLFLIILFKALLNSDLIKSKN